MSCFDAFHYKSYGTFCLHEKRLIISRMDLPTTEIIEPEEFADKLTNSFKIRKLSNGVMGLLVGLAANP